MRSLLIKYVNYVLHVYVIVAHFGTLKNTKESIFIHREMSGMW
jgi:hypothetical protein